jgi:hypothetical protein
LSNSLDVNLNSTYPATSSQWNVSENNATDSESDSYTAVLCMVL